MLKELINKDDFSIKTKRIQLLPLSSIYVYDYFKEFNSEITKYQYPDPFKSINEARNFFAHFVQCKKEGTSLVCIIADMEGTFIGSVEAHGIDTSIPELGIWIAQKYQSKGYGFEAIKGLMDYICADQPVDYFIYEADSRNAGSIKLINRLNGEKHGHEEFVTESGKKLKLDKYYIKGDSYGRTSKDHI